MPLVDRLPRGKRASACVTVAFVVVVLVLAWLFFHPMSDLRVYRVGGRALLDGARLYEVRDVNGLPFTYTPFAALLFVPAAVMSFPLSMLASALIGALALVRSGWLVGRLACGPNVRGVVVAAIVGVACVTEPVGWTFSSGQINLLILWLVLEDLAGAVPPRFRGVLVGVAAGIKLTPALFIVYFVATRRWADAARACAAGAVTFALGFLVQPSQAWKYWTDVAYDDDRMGGVAFAANQSIHGVVERLTGPAAPFASWAPVALVVAAIGIATAAALSRKGEQLLAITAVAFTMLLVSPISWNHHWVWVILLIGIVAVPGQSRAVQGWLIAAIVVFSSRCIWLAAYRHDKEYDVSGLGLVTQNAWAIIAVAVLAWLVTVARRPSTDDPLTSARPPAEETSTDGVPHPSR